MNLPDIETRQDIDRLLVRFYEEAMVDPEIGHHFATLDLVTHLPVIGDFWEKLLFARPVYFGSPLIVHQQLHAVAPLEPEHFERWLVIFRGTVDELFEGATADTAKFRAGVIANTLSQRLNGPTDIHIPPHQQTTDDARAK